MTEQRGQRLRPKPKLPYFSLEDPEFCEAYDAWIKTQGANDEPGEGTAEWEAEAPRDGVDLSGFSHRGARVC